MKFFKFSQFIFAGCSIILFTHTPAFALNQNNYPAIISFSDTETAKSLVYTSYMNLADIDKKLKSMQNLTLDALSGTKPSSEMYYLDLKFQSKKHDLATLLNESIIWFQIFSEDNITIEINNDGNGEHLIFNLPKTTMADLGLTPINITSADNAKLAAVHINTAIDQINSLLPSNLDSKNLSKFNKIDSTIGSSKLSISSIDDSKAILQSLVKTNKQLNYLLNRLLAIANSAATGEHTTQELNDLDMEFQSLFSELDRTLHYSCHIGNIKRFNDTKLTFKIDEESHVYTFTKIDLNIMNLTKDIISNGEAAQQTFKDLKAAFNWIKEWSVSGNTSFESVKVRNS